MNRNNNLIAVKILDRTYKVKCPSDQAHELQLAAQHLSEQMTRLKQNSNLNSTEGLAVVAALNTSHELMQLKKQKNQYIDSMHDKIQSLQKRIENFLASKEEVAV